MGSIHVERSIASNSCRTIGSGVFPSIFLLVLLFVLSSDSISPSKIVIFVRWFCFIAAVSFPGYSIWLLCYLFYAWRVCLGEVDNRDL